MDEEILVVGVSHEHTPVVLRELINPDVIFRTCMKHKIFREWTFIATCNRVELYVVTTDSVQAAKILQVHFPKQHTYLFINREAVGHLFKVASGLDSMILGESEIL